MNDHDHDHDHGTAATRRDYLKATGGVAAAGIAGVAGCMGGAEAATGTLATRVSDQPGDISDFESCVVTMAGFWVASGSDGSSAATSTETEASSDDEDDREYHEFGEPQEADLVELQGDRSALLGERELETGTYAFLQLDVTGVEATLADGGEATVDTPGGAPLKFDQSFEIREDSRTVFTADFTPVRRGQSGAYLLQPVASETGVSYEATTTATETSG